MKSATKPDVEAVNRSKIISIFVLFTIAAAIIISGVSFTIYSLYNNIGFKVINIDVSGGLFGLAVLYLGIRYFISVQKLRKKVYKLSSKFSWNNFRKPKIAKSK